MKKVLPIIILLSFVSAGFSVEKKQLKTSESKQNLCSEVCRCFWSKKPVAPCKEDKDLPPDNCGYNCSARTRTECGWNFYLDGSFIYWQPTEDLDFHTTQIVDVATSNIELIENNWKFDFHPGFKVGMGIYFNHDDWDLHMEYTRFKTENKAHHALTDNLLNPINSVTPFWVNRIENNLPIGSNFMFSEKAEWKLNVNLIDFDLGRSYFVGKKLIFKPLIGIRGGIINQKYNSTALYANGFDFLHISKLFARLKTDSWLIGPRVGLDTNWLLNSHFRIFGDLFLNFFYQKFHYNGKVFPIFVTSSPLSGFKKISISKKPWRVVPNLESGLGFGWGSYFHEKKWHFDLSAEYDFQIFWNQNILEKTTEIVQISTINNFAGSLMLHGLTVTGKIDF